MFLVLSLVQSWLPACAASRTNVLHQPPASCDIFCSSAQTLSDVVTELFLVFHGVVFLGLSAVSYSSAAQCHLVLMWPKKDEFQCTTNPSGCLLVFNTDNVLVITTFHPMDQHPTADPHFYWSKHLCLHFHQCRIIWTKSKNWFIRNCSILVLAF